MTRQTLGRAPRSVRQGPLDSADVDPATGALLSIAELQAALRRPGQVPGGPDDAQQHVPVGPPRARDQVVAGPVHEPQLRPVAEPSAGERGSTGAAGSVPAWLTGPGLVCVVGAHPGAGCSTVAVAVADACDRAEPAGIHLVECAPAATSGLAGVTDAELGTGPTGRWRHGRRGRVLVSRAAGDIVAEAPDHHGLGADPVTVRVVDLGVLQGPDVGAGLPPEAALVVVCRANLPGLRRLESLLAHLDRGRPDRPPAVAVVGPPRWPGVLQACIGPGLRGCTHRDQVVRVPLDRHLAVTGPTSAALPRRVLAAGDRLWDQIRSDRQIRSVGEQQ